MQPQNLDIAAVTEHTSALYQHDPEFAEVARKHFEKKIGKPLPLSEQKKILLQQKLFRVTPELRKKIPLEPAILSINGTELMSRYSLMGINGDINAGKSPLAEIIACMWIDPTCGKQDDFLEGMQMSPQEGNVLFIDTEREPDKLAHYVQSIWEKRLGHNSASIERLHYYPLRHIATKDRIQSIRILLESIPDVRFLIIDSLTQMVQDKNSISESNAAIDELFDIINTFKMPILCTMHGNRNDDSGKGTGHIGGVLQERSSTYLRFMYHPKDSDQRILTAKFQNSKVRWGKKENAVAAFEWDSEETMFIEIPHTEQDSAGGQIDLSEKFAWCYHHAIKSNQPVTGIRQADLIKLYQKCHNVSARQNILNCISEAVEDGFLIRHEINTRRIEYDFCREQIFKE